jgi:hypothetical protein
VVWTLVAAVEHAVRVLAVLVRALMHDVSSVSEEKEKEAEEEEE